MSSHVNTRKYRLIEFFTPYAMLLPSALVFAVFVIFPVFFSLYMSFFNWRAVSSTREFIGISNYAQLLTSSEFLHSVKVTFAYVAGIIPIGMGLGLVVALLLNRKMRGVTMYRVLYYLPVVTAWAAIGVVWRWIYQPSYGLLNVVLERLGLPIGYWLSEPETAMPSLIAVGAWKVIGYNAVIFLAGLQNVPQELYEAAEIDGAGGLRKFTRITWPLLTPTTFFLLIVSVINSFQNFSGVYVMTKGGPMESTRVIVYYLYQQAFVFFNMGYASAVDWILVLVVFLLTLLQMKFADNKVHYQ